jgi:uncharacterized membrane protein YfhO
VDGTLTSIHAADLMFRAVPVPAGRHLIELRYEPRGFIVGVVLFGVAASGCALGFFSWLRATRQGRTCDVD